jgi:sulfatase maturation enzyme AslB (radical SAM superfamily)
MAMNKKQVTITNRKWQNHLKAKGFIPFIFDRLSAHAKSDSWQHSSGAFNFPISKRELDDELTKYYFEMAEDFPPEIYIETTSHCNLNCAMCSRSKMTRPNGTMTPSLFKRIIDEIADNLKWCYVHMYVVGEPTMDSNLIERLNYTILKGLSNVVVFTNGQRLAENELYKKIADSGVQTIGIDLDGFSKEVYERVRIGGDFQKVKDGIKYLSAYIKSSNLSTRLEIAYHYYPGLNDCDLEKFIEWIYNEELEYKIVPLHQWANLRKDISAGVLPNGTSEEGAHNSPCNSLWSFIIHWSGNVPICFMDANGQYVQGNVDDSNVQNIWQGNLRKIRKKHVQGILPELCQSCSSNRTITMPMFKSNLYPNLLKGTGD